MINLHQRALPLAAALSLPFVATVAAPVVAQTQPKEIVVTASPREVALTNWSTRVQTNLQDQMQMPRVIGTNFSRDGLAEVSFVCSDSGKPEQVTLAKSSGSPRINRAALNAVRGITSLHPLPEGMKANQKVLAQLLFINSIDGGREANRRMKALQKEAAEHNAWFYRDEIASGDMLLLAAVR
jgi:TonB family protein